MCKNNSQYVAVMVAWMLVGSILAGSATIVRADTPYVPAMSQGAVFAIASRR